MFTESKLAIHKRVYSELSDAVLFVDKNEEIIWANQAAYQLLNMSQHVQNQSIHDYFLFNERSQQMNSTITVELKKNKNLFIDAKLIEIDDHNYCLILKKINFKEETVNIKSNIDRFMQASSEGMVMFKDEEIIDCDIEFASLFGYMRHEMLGMNLNKLMDDKKPKNKNEKMNEYSEGSYRLIGIKKNGETIHIELVYHPYHYQGSMLQVALIKNITEQVQHEKQLEYMAFYDELTGLPNRNFFIKKLKDAIEQARRTNELFSVSFIDLDYFKEIIETLGYDFGDHLLTAIGDKLNNFKDANTFIARMNGDKFLILQRDIKDKNATTHLAEQLISAFQKPIKIEGYDIFISISIGISIYPENGDTANDLIKHADSAMYVIKEKQRNSYKLFEPSISEKFKMMLTMESDLRKALAKGQFELHYQPQKKIKTNQLVGMEALLRWKHPEKGYISPMDFIPLAEKNGLIIEIGDWVLEEACRQNKEWQDQGYQPIVIGVNLSAKQFHQKNLLEKIEQTLRKTGLDPKYLELEITESIAMANEKKILKTLHHLRDIGVHVSIDDFGTGYSSLKYLSMFPISKLKIDKTFMDRRQKQNQAIVKSIINMSHSLNMTVIAEGVETQHQLEFLEKENCDEMQGFYFSKPLPPEQLVKYLRE